MKAVILTLATIIIASLTSCGQGSIGQDKVVTIKRLDNGKTVTRVIDADAVKQNGIVGVGSEVAVEYSESKKQVVYGIVESIENK